MARRLNHDVRCVVEAANIVGESPVWSTREQALYWVDILAPAVHRWTPGTGEGCTWSMPAAVGSIGLRAAGGLVAALRTGFHLVDTDTGMLTPLVNPEPDRPTNRLNDGKVAPDGSFWAGTMDDRPEKEPVGSLYRLGPDHHCTRMATGFKIFNGLAWSPDGRTLYHSDSRVATIWRYSHDSGSGRLGAREVFVAMQPDWGRPDGGAVDAEGCYWGCGIGAGRINRFSPKGELLEWIELPVTHPTMPCFGGPELKTLYVTSLRQNLTAEQLQATPLAGAVWQIDVDVAGTPVGLYEG
ncbi:MAG TPA: SMP-30/gluconolactonase/LRE family protein [Burkholderiaceae bacterium]|nr:SMP-30/gluconolactonase/LRE family protein [Burkholderiaceae bacterium]